ncbi:MAG: asparagine synthase, partial [Alphaproteobacteria bacterium]|nr:asparagine synthase [Alphaproteobacteria bacterium]
MSRIGGFHGEGARTLLPALLARLGDASPTMKDLGPALFGWLGRSGPRCAAEGRCIAVLDGHFYNRAELGAAASDAALLIALYRRHGFAGALDRINGDFAVALFDGDEEKLFLGRDRFGIKPLYYADRPNAFAFASRPGALLALPGMGGDINRSFVARFAASHYRTFDNAPDESPYAEIKQLPAGHLLERRGGAVRVARWWDLHEVADWREPEAELAERYRALLADAVRLRLAETTRPGFTLSGGLDSSSILSSAVAVSGTRQHAYSTVYADKT